MPTKDIIDVKDERDFEERVLKSREPVIISFDTPLCESCKITNDRLLTVLADGEENLSIAKVDVSHLEDLARKHDVLAIPTLAVASNGKIHSQMTGMKEITDIKNFVKESLMDRQKSIDDEVEFPIYVGPRYY
ncbi:hypothetical protein PVAND_017493 [Polypedilum vanderplanki]|uniref:Thioredoxin n=1 Tax=Polypedilum vanderplanki TaxID=319348 RepID=S6B7X4_POLVA|nr:hypothetical protein PVAND_017493 [Polypedilum vanderplanki]BAN67603.1 thioredoxin [Polypedilum vanderplanki]